MDSKQHAPKVGTDNRTFWNARYIELPELGSGPASRGYAIVFKRNLVRAILADHDIATVLDIGCGDMSYIQGDLFGGRIYTGVDISDVIVERNAKQCPGSRFLCHDISREPLQFKADLVISFDMLIHQLSREAFESALGNTLDCTKKLALMSYSTPPLADGVIPDVTPSELGPEELRYERALEDVLARSHGRRIGMGTAFHGALDASIRAIRPSMEVSPISSYRHHTVYIARHRAAE